MEWKAMATPDLVNLANQLGCILNESRERETTKIIHVQLWQMKAPKENQFSALNCKEPGPWKKYCYHLKNFRDL